MPRFSANLGFLFREKPLLLRFLAARNAGFQGVEIFGPEEASARDIALAASDAGVEIVLCNAPVGDGMTGGPGLSGVPGRQAQFLDAIRWAAEFAGTIGCGSVNIGPSRVPREADRMACLGVLAENLNLAGDLLGSLGLRALVEPLNSNDFSDILLCNADDAVAAIRASHHSNVFLQFDLYHMYQMHPDVFAVLESRIGQVAHIQFADVPGRGEPGTGEIDFDRFLATLERLRYPGWIGAEYRTGERTEDTLDWLRCREQRLPP